jgi:hypothetical protein
MKKLIIAILFINMAYSQNTTIHFYYGTEKMLGSEVMFHIRNTESIYLGGGFNGALEQNRETRPIPNDEKWCSLYATGSTGFIWNLLMKYKAGLAVYTGKNDFKEVLYKPLIGIGAMYPITKDIGLEIGYDTFNNGTIGFTILF